MAPVSPEKSGSGARSTAGSETMRVGDFTDER